MKIREANVDDIEQLINLWKETGLYFEPFDKKEKLIEKITNEPELFLVMEHKNKVVGTVIGNYGWRVSIDHMAIYKEYRNPNIEKQLLEEIKERLKIKGAEIALIDSNLPKRLLERAGFKYRDNYNNYTIEL